MYNLETFQRIPLQMNELFIVKYLEKYKHNTVFKHTLILFKHTTHKDIWKEN